MKTLYLLLHLLLLSHTVLAQTPWRVTAVDPMLSTSHTLTVRITAEADEVNSPNGFAMVYHKSYIVGDTLFVRPYYNAMSAGSGFPMKRTVVNDLYIGAYGYNSLFFKYLCVTPYEVWSVDTSMYLPTPHPPNHCFDMKNVVSVADAIVDKGITLYPNPATSMLHIATNESYQQGRIYNSMGQMVQVVDANSKQVNISKLPTGNYYLQLTTKEKIRSKAFVVVR